MNRSTTTMIHHTAIISLLLISFAGCWRAPTPSGKVSGKVTSQGKPLDVGNVQFVKTDGVPVGAAELGPQGEFQFPATIPVGEYRVAVLPPSTDIPPGTSDPKLEAAVKKIPPKYRSATSSGFTAVVKEGDNNVNLEIP